MKVSQIVEILNENGINVDIDSIIEQLDNIGAFDDIDEENVTGDFDVEEAIVKKFSKKYKIDIKPKKDKRQSESAQEINKRGEDKKPAQGKFKAENEKKIEDILKQEIKNDEIKPKVEPVKENSQKDKKKEDKTSTKNDVKKEAKNSVNEVKNNKAPQNDQNKAKNNQNNGQKSKENREIYNQEKENLKNLEEKSFFEEKYEDLDSEKTKYKRLKNVKKNKNNKQMKDRQANAPIEKSMDEKVVYYSEGMTVSKLADSLNKNLGEIVRRLVMLGYMASASDILEKDVIELIAEDFGYTVKDEINDDITKFEEMDIVDDPASLVERPPIVTIMGHVDHGKTTLLDTIRNSHITSGEAGGITQAIGAYQVKKNGKLITFIDTPGHAAFTEMRARGANITDIVILVVAADDGVMPQTKEAIEHAKAAGVPIIVAINKMDKVGANPDKIKQELASYDLLAEEWGGKTIFVPISALRGTGVDDLLEMVLLVSEMNEYKANPNRLAIGTVIEAKLDKGKGSVATLLVKNGSLRVGDPIVVGNTWGKIRAMTDETKKTLSVALPSKAVEVTGLVDVPNAGDSFMVFGDEKTARLICEERIKRKASEELKTNTVSLASMFENNEDKKLNLLIKGDVQGSIEALIGSLEKLNVEGVKVNVVRGAVGAITETDISLATVSKSIIIAFNVRSSAQIQELAKEKGIEIRYYDIIYKLLEDIEAAMKGMLDPVYEEKVIGEAEVRETYKVSKVGTIAGCYVRNGIVSRNASVRLIRDSIVVYTGKISSLKRFKDDVKEVNQGFECGITIERFNDIKVGDVFEIFELNEVNQNGI